MDSLHRSRYNSGSLMHLEELSEADKHLLYGSLLKKKRSGSEESKVLMIVRSEMGLDARIEALLKVSRVRIPDAPHGSEGTSEPGKRMVERRRTPGRRKAALVVDARSEITGLLRKCSLKKEVSFSKVGERFDAIPLIPHLRARLVIINESFPTDREYLRYFEICRAIEPRIAIIFLARPAASLEANPLFRGSVRFVPKPINVERIEQSVRELLAVRRDAQA